MPYKSMVNKYNYKYKYRIVNIKIKVIYQSFIYMKI